MPAKGDWGAFVRTSVLMPHPKGAEIDDLEVVQMNVFGQMLIMEVF